MEYCGGKELGDSVSLELKESLMGEGGIQVKTSRMRWIHWLEWNWDQSKTFVKRELVTWEELEKLQHDQGSEWQEENDGYKISSWKTSWKTGAVGSH